ncbi:hypothetical protein [Ensifer canadensis]|jgi:hypothetical protein
MSTTVVVLLILAGLSESAGQVLPLLARRQYLSPRLVVGLIVTGTAVEGSVMALWPQAAWIIADLVRPVVAPDAIPLSPTIGLAWTPVLIAPLLLTAVLAFPLLGPFLHSLLVAGVGAGLAGPLAAASGLGWWTAAGCIGVAGIGLSATVGVARRMIARIIAGVQEQEAVL